MSNIVEFFVLSLNSSADLGGIGSNDIRRLPKRKMYIPTRINDIEHHINHGLHILIVIVGDTSFIIIQISDYLK